MDKIVQLARSRLTQKKKSYTGVTCKCNMHLTPKCTALSPAAITGIKKLGMYAMLLCKICVEKNERDNFTLCRNLAKVAEKIDSSDVAEKLKNMERQLTELVDEKIGNTKKTTSDKIEKTYAAMVSAEVTKGKHKGVENDENSKSNNFINKCIRIQEIPEVPNKTKGENLVPTNIETNDVLDSIGANALETEIQRPGKFRNDRKNPRAAIVTLANEHEARIIFAVSQEIRKNLVERDVYILQKLTRDDALEKTQMLKKRRECLTELIVCRRN